MQKIELEEIDEVQECPQCDGDGVIESTREGMHRVPCPDCVCGQTLDVCFSMKCLTCGGAAELWKDNNPAPLPAKRCPKCAGIGWMLPHTALEHCDICDGLGKVAQYD